MAEAESSNALNMRHEAQAALKHAVAATRRGALAEAERWSKTAERLALAAEKLAPATPPVDFAEEERLREMMRERMLRFCEEAHAQAFRQIEMGEAAKPFYTQAELDALQQRRAPQLAHPACHFIRQLQLMPVFDRGASKTGKGGS